VLGFTEDVHGLMGLADLCVMKPGGLTVSEAMACGLPAVAHRPTPGQEYHNMRHIVSQGTARVTHGHRGLQKMLPDLLRSDDALSRMGERAESRRRPRRRSIRARA